MDKGTRVGAIRSADEKTVFMYGYGEYVGDEESPIGLPNPRIKLDNGKMVWGFQCWWASDERVKSIIGDREVVMVNIDD